MTDELSTDPGGPVPTPGPADTEQPGEPDAPGAQEELGADDAPGAASEDEASEHAAVRMLRAVPAIGGLPGPLVALLGLGLASYALLLLLEALGLALGVLYKGLGDFLTVLLVSMISAYLLDPVIDRFEKAGWNRTRAILLSLTLFVIVDVVVLLLLVPYVVTELADLTNNIDTYIEDFGSQLSSVEEFIGEATGREVDLRFASMAERLPELLQKLPSGSLDPLGSMAQGLVGWFGGFFGFIVHWALFPIFTFFFLRDFDTMKRSVFGLVPHRWRRAVLDHYLEIDAKMAQFLRGQFMLCCLLAVLYATGLGLFTDIDLAILVGVVSGLLFIVPYFGTFIGLFAGTLLAVLKFGVSFEILKVWAVFGGVQALEGAVLTPKIVGDSVGLHPVVVMLSLVVGANLFGFLGILLGVPAAAAGQVLVATAIARYKRTGWFLRDQEGAPSESELP